MSVTYLTEKLIFHGLVSTTLQKQQSVTRCSSCLIGSIRQNVIYASRFVETYTYNRHFMLLEISNYFISVEIEMFWKTELSITNVYENSSHKVLDNVTFPTQVSKHDEALS